MTKADKVKELLAENLKPKVIAKKAGCTVQYVYTIRSRMRPIRFELPFQLVDKPEPISAQQSVLQQKLWLVPAPKLSWAQRFKVLFTGVV